MLTEVILRPARRGEGPALARVHLASRRAAAMPASVHTEAELSDWLDTRLDTRLGDEEVWVGEVDGVLAGYARLTRAWLDDLYVVPERAGTGIGSALLDLVKSRRPHGFCLWVFATNQAARGFYSRRGLIELEGTDGSANEESAPDIRMAWPGPEPLRFLRGLIDDVDADLGDLLARRVALTRAVQPHKVSTERDPVREREVAEALARRAPELGVERTARIAEVIITESLSAAREHPPRT